MIDKLINKLQKEGKIRKQKVGIIQIEALLRDAVSDARFKQLTQHLYLL